MPCNECEAMRIQRDEARAERDTIRSAYATKADSVLQGLLDSAAAREERLREALAKVQVALERRDGHDGIDNLLPTVKAALSDSDLSPTVELLRAAREFADAKSRVELPLKTDCSGGIGTDRPADVCEPRRYCIGHLSDGLNASEAERALLAARRKEKGE